MKAHDVRHLRHCKICEQLGHKDDFIHSGDRCLACAFTEAGGLDQFLELYPWSDCEKLPIGLIGFEGMQRLIAIAEARAK